MPVFNFQKPDKVIMIDSSEFEGKFEFRPLEPLKTSLFKKTN